MKVRWINACTGISLLQIMFVASGCGPLPSEPALAARAHPGAMLAVDTIEIKQMAFIPQEIVVNEGGKVVFINRDMVTHDITEMNKTWHSSALKVGESWVFVAEKTAGYYCSIHPVMKGRIVVK